MSEIGARAREQAPHSAQRADSSNSTSYQQTHKRTPLEKALNVGYRLTLLVHFEALSPCGAIDLNVSRLSLSTGLPRVWVHPCSHAIASAQLIRVSVCRVLCVSCACLIFHPFAAVPAADESRRAARTAPRTAARAHSGGQSRDGHEQRACCKPPPPLPRRPLFPRSASASSS